MSARADLCVAPATKLNIHRDCSHRRVLQSKMVRTESSGRATELVELRAEVAVAILDFAPERAAVVRRLNQAGIPVIAWIMLPKEENPPAERRTRGLD
jgi:hypothetical protein